MLYLCPEPSDGFITKSEINTEGNTKFWGNQQGLSDLGPTPSGTTSQAVSHTLAHTPADSRPGPADTQPPARALPGTCLLPQITSGSHPRFFRSQHKGCGFWKTPSQPSLFSLFSILFFFFMKLATTQYIFLCLFTGMGGLQGQGFFLLIALWRTQNSTQYLCVC